MTNVYEVETQNGRIFRIIIENRNQLRRFHKTVDQNKHKTYEKIIRCQCILNGIHNISDFEKINRDLV